MHQEEVLQNYRPKTQPINLKRLNYLPGNLDGIIPLFVSWNIAIENTISLFSCDKALENDPAKMSRGKSIIKVSQALN